MTNVVFRPTKEEFSNFQKYIEHIESQGSAEVGLIKIIPPKEWVPRKCGYGNLDNIKIAVIEQDIVGKNGIYQQRNRHVKEMTMQRFKKLSRNKRRKPPEHHTTRELSDRYWSNVTGKRYYGADNQGSLMDADLIPGITTPFLYIGHWRSSFPWHTEDMDLYSINYVHCGAPKHWYCVPPSHAHEFEALLSKHFPALSSKCRAFMRHKLALASPEFLMRNNIPFTEMTQYNGEIIVTFPKAYHSGFNAGFNIAEAANFATERWVELGHQALQCYCNSNKGTVNLDINMFYNLNYNLCDHTKENSSTIHSRVSSSENCPTMNSPTWSLTASPSYTSSTMQELSSRTNPHKNFKNGCMESVRLHTMQADNSVARQLSTPPSTASTSWTLQSQPRLTDFRSVDKNLMPQVPGQSTQQPHSLAHTAADNIPHKPIIYSNTLPQWNFQNSCTKSAATKTKPPYGQQQHTQNDKRLSDTAPKTTLCEPEVTSLFYQKITTLQPPVYSKSRHPEILNIEQCRYNAPSTVTEETPIARTKPSHSASSYSNHQGNVTTAVAVPNTKQHKSYFASSCSSHLTVTTATPPELPQISQADIQSELQAAADDFISSSNSLPDENHTTRIHKPTTVEPFYIRIGSQKIDLSTLEQLIDPEDDCAKNRSLIEQCFGRNAPETVVMDDKFVTQIITAIDNEIESKEKRLTTDEETSSSYKQNSINHIMKNPSQGLHSHGAYCDESNVAADLSNSSSTINPEDITLSSLHDNESNCENKSTSDDDSYCLQLDLSSEVEDDTMEQENVDSKTSASNGFKSGQNCANVAMKESAKCLHLNTSTLSNTEPSQIKSKEEYFNLSNKDSTNREREVSKFTLSPSIVRNQALVNNQWQSNLKQVNCAFNKSPTCHSDESYIESSVDYHCQLGFSSVLKDKLESKVKESSTAVSSESDHSNISPETNSPLWEHSGVDTDQGSDRGRCSHSSITNDVIKTCETGPLVSLIKRKNSFEVLANIVEEAKDVMDTNFETTFRAKRKRPLLNVD